MTEEQRMTVPQFNLELNIAQDLVEISNGERLAEQQARLRELVPLLDENERDWATDLIDWLPDLAKPAAPPSPLMQEAMAIERAAVTTRGGRAERIAAMDDARRKIFAIADRAPRDEAAHIRGLTRTMDHLQAALADPFWTVPEDDGPTKHQEPSE